MTQADDFVHAALKALIPKPAPNAQREIKKRYSELLSQHLALAFAGELRRRGLTGIRPSTPGEASVSGAERRIAGGIGAKKVDVTWATEDSGLLLAISIKSISFMDSRSQNYQKNLTNRRGDMLFESVTLHRRFPYAVLAGFMFLDVGAANDQTGRRRSTFVNAHQRFRLSNGRDDPGGRDEQYERFYIVLQDANPFAPTAHFYLAGHPDEPVPISRVFDELIELVAERNSDFYEYVDGRLLTLT